MGFFAEWTTRLLPLDHLDSVRDRPPEEIVNSTVDTLAPNADDDVVAFAVRVP